MSNQTLRATVVAWLCACSSLAWAALPIEHWTQASGVRVYLVNSPSIPMVDVQIDLDAGSRRDPRDKTGLAQSMAGAVSYGVRAQGNLPALSENALNDAWADLGASFGGSASDDRMTFSLRSLTEPDLLQRAVALAARQLGTPAFVAPLWQRDRLKWIAGLQEADTRPATHANRAFQQAVLGDHPYGREVTAASLQRIQVQDMQALHAQVVRPCYAQVSIVGAVDRQQADALVTQLFAHVPARSCPPLPVVPEVAPLTAAQELRLDFTAAQAHVLVGQTGYRRADPDHFALMVGNHILGGSGFGALLTQEVREKRGLTYSVYSFFDAGRHAGPFTIGLQTRPDQAQQALDLVREVLTRFVAEGPTDEQLQAAKANLIGGFPLMIENNRKLVGNVANIAWNGLPLNYLDTWAAQVERITAADVKAAMQRKLNPQAMVTVVLGAKTAAKAKD